MLVVQGDLSWMLFQFTTLHNFYKKIKCSRNLSEQFLERKHPFLLFVSVFPRLTNLPYLDTYLYSIYPKVWSMEGAEI